MERAGVHKLSKNFDSLNSVIHQIIIECLLVTGIILGTRDILIDKKERLSYKQGGCTSLLHGEDKLTDLHKAVVSTVRVIFLIAVLIASAIALLSAAQIKSSVQPELIYNFLITHGKGTLL